MLMHCIALHSSHHSITNLIATRVEDLCSYKKNTKDTLHCIIKVLSQFFSSYILLVTFHPHSFPIMMWGWSVWSGNIIDCEHQIKDKHPTLQWEEFFINLIRLVQISTFLHIHLINTFQQLSGQLQGLRYQLAYPDFPALTIL